MGSIWSSRKLAVLGVKAGNSKLGEGAGAPHTTSVSQLSCPDGQNNSYRCPLYGGGGCYAEDGRLAMGTTKKVNDAAGLDRSKGSSSSQYTAQDVADDEAEVISQVVASQAKLPPNKWPLMRLHIVGDAPTDEAAKTLRDAVGDYPHHDQIPGERVWAYTHAWRTVSRSSWGDHISVLASCDTPEDVIEAHSRGYAAAIVVPCFKRKAAYDSGYGFKILPCLEESDKPENLCGGVKAAKGEETVGTNFCKTCRLCLQDKRLRNNKLVIAFAVHNAVPSKKSALKKKLLPVFGE